MREPAGPEADALVVERNIRRQPTSDSGGVTLADGRCGPTEVREPRRSQGGVRNG